MLFKATGGNRLLTSSPPWFSNLTKKTVKIYPLKIHALPAIIYTSFVCFPSDSEVKASACNAGDLGSIPGLGRSPGEGNGNPLQYSCLENPMDRGAWWATVHGVAKSRTRPTKRLNDTISQFIFSCCLDSYKAN